ncbi:MAG: N-acetylmuramoyl-L-alanine amidase-like domain-containing protein [Phycisphaerae bacterium]
MRHVVLIACAILSAAGCGASSHIRSSAELTNTPLYTFNEQELDEYLQSLDTRRISLTRRVERLARKNIGQPYRLFLLGEFPHELYDPDPMYCLSASDCVTFVEHTYAMAFACDWSSFFRTLQRIRYKDGAIGILTRNHFTEADWNVNNAWLFEDVTEGVANGETRRMIVRVDRARFFAKYGLGQDIPIQRFETSYISRASLPRCVSNLRTGDVIEIVRGTDDAPYVSHMGLCLRAGAECRLIHSAKPAVREEGLLDYVKRHENVKGVKVLRVREEALDSI